MTKKNKKLKLAQKSLVSLIFLLVLSSNVVFAKDEDVKKFGVHMAVTAFSSEDGFQLSERALNFLNIKFQKLTTNGPWKIPKSALVYIKRTQAVYWRESGWVSLVSVDVISKEKDFVLIRSDDLKGGDEIAISGTPFLRMTELDLNAETVDTCSH